MTEQEAIEFLERIRSKVDYTDAIDAAIGALKKQEPEDVILAEGRRHGGRIAFDTARCPSCGFTMDDDSDPYEETSYCPNCGQRWEWRTEK